jgi:hypothetical protein
MIAVLVDFSAGLITVKVGVGKVFGLILIKIS